ncbi:unnamed protein product [Hymenolepis diminuta]|uniref:Transaldolase n=1 Tax=Hymenolepis diminuta TaxID=6216 RepID=A0A0R3SZ59_HYMDI|nr:unnamed protein product [Hymenolepis diminuta]
MPSTLNFLKKHTVVVVDSGDLESIQKFSPIDATTNPSLILAASKMPKYSKIIEEAVKIAKGKGKTLEEQIEIASEYTLVMFGIEILKIIPGRVSVEVDARLSFDKEKQIAKALKLISLYEEMGIPKERILIKLSSTWEGIQAAKELESKHGVHCNLTLIFAFAQAVACAEAKVTLISPFKFGYKTEVMGASLHNVNQILGLVGCDLLTVSPNLLEELANMTEVSEVTLDVKKASSRCEYKEPLSLDEATFRWMMNEDVVATEVLADSIRNFAVDLRTLDGVLREHLLA